LGVGGLARAKLGGCTSMYINVDKSNYVALFPAALEIDLIMSSGSFLVNGITMMLPKLSSGTPLVDSTQMMPCASSRKSFCDFQEAVGSVKLLSLCRKRFLIMSS
jgi:hypothetical protein